MKYIVTITLLAIGLAGALTVVVEQNKQLRQDLAAAEMEIQVASKWLDQVDIRIENLESRSRSIQKQCIELLYTEPTNGV